MIRIRVNGRPAPQGSKHKGAHGQMREASPYLPAWRAAVRNTAHRHLLALGVPVEVRPHLRGAVVVRRLVFIMDPSQPLDGPPDLDKLQRAVFDALTHAGLWEDDARVRRVELLDERHPRPGELPGCVIEVDSFQETEQDQMTQKLYRLVLEEVEVNGSAPVVVGQVVGDAAMVESVLPALARRLAPVEPIAPVSMSDVGTGAMMQQAAGGVVGASPAAIPPAAAAPAETPKRRGRPSKAELERRAAAEAAAQGAAAPIVQQPAAPAAPPAYDPFAAVAGAAQ